ncbi:MAG: acylneuraminate cytidylyltransferase family protein [Patescibacteria group bacterium]|jgi:N-acylneuraminate cytidylyltransferase/CMP-N,N'-diacetyllegionaminic acid synthase
MDKVLAYIPARVGSKRIKDKNIKNFLGKPLISYTIKQARACGFVSKIIVDTDSPKIAEISKKYGAETPWLRPVQLASDKSNIRDAIAYILERLKKEQKYTPDYILLLQTTSPLRELRDIEACWELIKKTKADTVLTVCPTHPRLYYLDENKNIVLANGNEKMSTNIQDWRPAYILNGCFAYIFKTKSFLKEKNVIMKNTKAVICDKWRSVDLDEPEDWALAEILFKNKNNLAKRAKKIYGEK